MSGSSTKTPKAASIPGASADEHALAQVEKWMAMIREIGREQGGKRQALTEHRPGSN